nr:putative reverse transcriptase domain-containing protein [Tanacetum cinerariifolium]
MPTPWELDEHVPVYVPEPEHPEYHAPSDDDILVEDDDEDPEEDPSEEHKPEDDDEDSEEDSNEEHEPEDEDNKEPFKGSDETEPFEEDEIAVTPPPPRHRLRAAMIRRRDGILEEDMPPQRRFALTGPPPGCDVAESSAAAARAPRSQYNFVDTVEAGQGLVRSPGHDTQTIARATDRAEDVGYVRRQESVNFYTQLLDAQTDRRDVRLEIDRRHSAEDLVVTQMMRIHTLEARSRADTVEDADSSFILTMHVTRQGKNDAMTPESIQAMIDQAIQRNSTHTQDDASQSSDGGLRRPVQPARVCSYTDFMKCQPLNFKGTEGIVRLSQCLEKIESIFHISGCAIDNQGTLKKKLMGKYCPKGEIKKLEIELWNLRVKGNDVAAYTQRFQELASMCTKFLADETEKVDKEMLIFQGNGDNQREESPLNIISCTKAQEYLSKGCDVFLANVTTKEAKDKSKGKRLEDVPIVRDFPEVFPEDLSGIPPARPVEFQIDLVPGVVLVARAPY